MRRLVLLLPVGMALSACNGDSRQESNTAETADLLNEATVDAILGANIPPEALMPANEINEAGSDANAANPTN